ncbi:acyl-CoA dehydrogenase family protein [Nocardia ignorata]|uniref:Alkylation response protein AidB-like acyl-CoA dehydrogenase n=1 Tax=Nocardia ignorata TaxID=145285 RepID=A0A4R6PQZ2_NOCIG|nr:acyl-CoA dehydrogenase family protein [Nocardia ignorata]TDP41215.1 alkylation response protein AidB-like acyl-CoA dehydrogenase [Nocardia ignorata]
MQLALTEDELAFRDELRAFFRQEIPDDIRNRTRHMAEVSKDDIVTTQRILNAHGLAVPHWPVEWGGRDWTPVQRHIWHDEMQLASVPEPLTFNTNMIGPVIAQFGAPEMKQRFLPATANLDIWWCQGFSEPEAGSDLASLRTVAVRDGDDYVINGQKTWTTAAQSADWMFCLARTDPNAPKKQAGISMLLFPLDTPGVTVRPIELIDGGFEVNEVFLEDVRVPADQLVGQENQGWTYAKFLLGNERTGIAAVGQTKVRLWLAKEHAKQTRLGSGTLLDDPMFAARIAELENELIALELVQARVVAGSADGAPNPVSSILKLRGTELQQAVTELLVDIAGPDSLARETDEPDWARRSTATYLNYRKTSIYGGSSEVQRSIIASTILGL